MSNLSMRNYQRISSVRPMQFWSSDFQYFKISKNGWNSANRKNIVYFDQSMKRALCVKRVVKRRVIAGHRKLLKAINWAFSLRGNIKGDIMECLYFVSTWGRKSNISKREMIRMIKGKCETNKRSNNKYDSRRSG